MTTRKKIPDEGITGCPCDLCLCIKLAAKRWHIRSEHLEDFHRWAIQQLSNLTELPKPGPLRTLANNLAVTYPNRFDEPESA